jgi:ribosomal protein S18 acetylase RimI-like enzyme
MAVRIRRGDANDAEFLAWVTLSASRGHLKRGLWDVIVGAGESGCLDYLKRLSLAEPRSLYHYESFLVAETDGAPAAALCGFVNTRDAWSIVGEAMAKVQRELGWTESEATSSYQRIAPIWNACMPPDIGADFVIENVAALPQYRRRGLVNALIEEALQDACQHRCGLAQITLYIGNHAALSAYKKSGFEFRDEKRCSELENILAVPGFLRLTKSLKIQ